MTALTQENASAKVPGRRGAMYVRMSTDLQQYSIENQEAAIREYAARHRIDIVRTYADTGRSGLSLDGREALQALIHDVQSGSTDYKVILVLDVTRWGRFQDADESAYYEFLCRRVGISVQYVAEQFDNDGSLVSTIMKSVKRTMAAEYSRELSGKVLTGQCRIVAMGFRLGGSPGYGLRRVLLDGRGNVRAVMSHGDRKAVQTDRIKLVPGPEAEIEVVRWIYQAYIEEQLSEKRIAALLNAQGIMNEFGRPWLSPVIHRLLTNEKYIGNNVFNLTSGKLKSQRRDNPPDIWVRVDGAFEGIIEPEIFYAAQRTMRDRNHISSNAEILNNIRELWRSRGVLSYALIDEASDLPSARRICERFGGLREVYRLIGYDPRYDLTYGTHNQIIKKMYPAILANVIRRIESLGAKVRQDPVTEVLIINDEIRVSLVICRCRKSRSRSGRWYIDFDKLGQPDVTIAIRLGKNNLDIMDYYIIPATEVAGSFLQLRPTNHFALDAYRFEDLDQFIGMAERVPVCEAVS